MPVYEVDDPDYGLQSSIMTGNYLALDSINPIYTLCSLNPGRITSKNNHVYFVLNLVYHSSTYPLTIKSQDSLTIYLDSGSLELKPHDIQVAENEISAFYEINRYDLIDIANSQNVTVTINAQNKILTSRFNEKNKYNFKVFAAKYVLNSGYEPEYPKAATKKHWGFSGAGVGSGYEMWLGRYLNWFTNKSDEHMQDFLALGIGYSSFSYQIKGLRLLNIPDPENPLDSIVVVRYWQDEEITNYIPAPGIVYGWSFKNIVSSWSLEAGVSIQYHFLPTWQESSDSVYVPEHEKYYPLHTYHYSQANMYDGFSAGIFLQLGGMWARINTRKSWAVGLSLPVPWW